MLKIGDTVRHKLTGQILTIKRFNETVATCDMLPKDCFPLFANMPHGVQINVQICLWKI